MAEGGAPSAVPDAHAAAPARWCLQPAARRGFGALLALLIVVVAWFAFTPAPPRTLETVWDKLHHALAFTALAWVAELAVWPQRGHRWRVALGLLAWGGVIEIVQSQLPTRSAEWGDLLADAVGIAFGLLLALPCLRGGRAPIEAVPTRSTG
ncbi:MAG TPA: VanZ family protein [Rubrivivax sp.]|nr:VanZ family protein [Burkholderiales bacterium]HNT38960.1 VanZ family protein [Rubrivivax sp.]